MSTIVTRSGKGSPLTHNEVDTNFSNLNTDKIQSGNTVAALTITSASITDIAVTGTVSFDGAQGTAGQVLTSAGTGATPTWATVSASSANNLSGGALGSVPYQLLSGTTTFLAGNTTNTPQFLTSTGLSGVATAPTYTGSTGSGNVVLSTSPTLTTPNLGTPSAINLTNATNLGYSALPAGSILQVVSATLSTEVTNATTTFADTNLTASITPKFATSKILVMVSQSTYKSPGNASNATSVKLIRGSTDLGVIIYLQGYTGTAINLYSSASMQYLDSPATTSSVTYKTQFANFVGFSYVSVQPDNASPSRITLMEIAA